MPAFPSFLINLSYLTCLFLSFRASPVLSVYFHLLTLLILPAKYHVPPFHLVLPVSHVQSISFYLFTALIPPVHFFFYVIPFLPLILSPVKIYHLPCKLFHSTCPFLSLPVVPLSFLINLAHFTCPFISLPVCLLIPVNPPHLTRLISPFQISLPVLPV